MYGTVQSGVITKTSMIRSTTAGTSTSVGLVELMGCVGSLVKGSSLIDGAWRCSKNTLLGMGLRVEPIFTRSSAAWFLSRGTWWSSNPSNLFSYFLTALQYPVMAGLLTSHSFIT